MSHPKKRKNPEKITAYTYKINNDLSLFFLLKSNSKYLLDLIGYEIKKNKFKKLSFNDALEKFAPIFNNEF